MENKNNDKGYYFVEGATDNDLIGFKSYVRSLKSAIELGARSIGIISDFGTGKSSLIRMLENELNNEYKFVKVNLWNIDNSFKRINIHQVFLHQLIDELNVSPRNYYKNKINKYYRNFDVEFKEKRLFIFIFLVVFYLMIFFDKIEMLSLFPSDFHKIIVFLLISFFTVLCIIYYKPLLSFSRDSSLRTIDENDTKDLYYTILDKYFNTNKNDILSKFFNNKKNSNNNRKNMAKPLIISLEDIDRYDDYESVIRYIKEFYKFYKISNFNVVFITGIKSASKMVNSDHNKEKVAQIKGTYEKVFDYILNLNRINILDYDEILFNIINEDNIIKPLDIVFPDKSNIDKWRYIYQGKGVTIRDIKHRYNFALSLFESVKESGVVDVDFYKCIFISYLEDEYNILYEFLINNPVIFNELLVYFSSNKNLDFYLHKKYDNFIFDEESIKILIDAFSQKLISADYSYYFFKYPFNKKSYNMHELILYNSILFDEPSEMLKTSLDKIEKETIIELLNKRNNITIYPNVVFEYPILLNTAYNYSQKTIYNTLNTIYDLISNFSKFKEIFYKIHKSNKVLCLEIFSNYFNIKKDKILELNIDERNKLRFDLVNLFKTDSILFDYMFLNDNVLITTEEMKIINDFNTIVRLTNYYKIDEIYVSNIIKYVKFSCKTNIITFIKNLSMFNNITNEMYSKVFYSINFSIYFLLDANIKEIYKYSKEKLDLDNKSNFFKFISKIDKYNDYLNDILVSLLDYSNKEDITRYIKVCEYNNYASKQSVDFISKYDSYLKLPNVLLNKMYEEKYYKYYVISKLMVDKLYQIEHDKFDVLKDFYIFAFANLEKWTYQVDDEMRDFLFNNVDFYNLPLDRLSVFSCCKQNKKLILAVFDTNDHDFIMKYLSQIKSIDRNDEKEIFEIIGKYYKEFGINYRIRKHVASLINDIKLKNLLDGRKNK